MKISKISMIKVVYNVKKKQIIKATQYKVYNLMIKNNLIAKKTHKKD